MCYIAFFYKNNMANFQQHIEKAKSLQPEKVSKALFQFIRSIEKQILDKNKEQLFEKSQDIHGQAIGFYSKGTEIITAGRKKAGEPFTAKETGDFFDGFYLQEVSGVLRFGSTDPKTSKILSAAKSEFNNTGWLSDQLFGLTDENLNKLIETELKPFIITYYRNTLGI